ncbi:MAG: HAD family acid phosphatase [Pyrobaculum sp.]
MMSWLPPCRAVVVDLDGVLFDVSRRLEACLKEAGGRRGREFWECFQSARYMHLDVPNPDAIEYVKKKDEGYCVIIVTGRDEEKQSDATVEQLVKYGVPWNCIVFRRSGDFRKAAELKAEVLDRLAAAGVEVAELIDDDPAVVEMAAKRGIKAVKWPPSEAGDRSNK